MAACRLDGIGHAYLAREAVAGPAAAADRLDDAFGTQRIENVARRLAIAAEERLDLGCRTPVEPALADRIDDTLPDLRACGLASLRLCSSGRAPVGFCDRRLRSAGLSHQRRLAPAIENVARAGTTAEVGVRPNIIEAGVGSATEFVEFVPERELDATATRALTCRRHGGTIRLATTKLEDSIESDARSEAIQPPHA